MIKNSNIDALLMIGDFSLSNQRKILTELNLTLIDCTQDLYDNNIRFNDAGLFEKLLFQIIFHNETLLTLTLGKSLKIRDKNLKINDLTSVYSIARLQIETFINLSYLFFIDTEYSNELKAIVYKIHGLRKQVELTKINSKHLKPIKKIRTELAEELTKLKSLDKFKNLENHKKKKFTNPYYARLMKPDELYSSIKIGNLSRIHSLYSNHIHSEYISIRQLKSAINNKNQYEKDFSNVTLLFSRITSLVITNMTKQYLLNKSSFLKAPEKRRKIILEINKLSEKL